MKENIRNYAELGLVHHLLYNARVDDPAGHAETLRKFIRRTDIDTLDCCLPLTGDQSELAEAVRTCGKSISFAIHFYPLRTDPLAAKTSQEKARRDAVLLPMIDQARSIGAKGFIFGAGTPSCLNARPEDFAAFDDFLDFLCPKLAEFGADALLEPFDFDIDKCFLYGPVDSCVELAERTLKRHRNFGFELDMAHLPLMHEDFVSSIRRLAPYLKRVHLGNCVEKPGCERYGDTHPPMEFPNGSIGEAELVTILKTLLEVGFLTPGGKSGLVLEMTPYPDLSPEETVERSFALLDRAWKKV